MKRQGIRFGLVLCGAALQIGLSFSEFAAAQGSSAGHLDKSGSASVEKKEIKFEIFSLRPNKPGSSPYSLPMNITATPTPDGYIARLTISQMIWVAYTPGGPDTFGNTHILNLPTWTNADGGVWYDINARVSYDDMAAWRKQGSQHELLSSALQAALKERCRLVVHKQPIETPVFNLVIGKKGPKLKAAVAGAAPSTDRRIQKLAGGGVLLIDGKNGELRRFYGATMEELVAFLNVAAQGRPVRDMTGLTGRYDFTLNQIDEPSYAPGEAIYNFPMSDVWLQLRPGKSTGFTLVVDHIEKPTPN